MSTINTQGDMETTVDSGQIKLCQKLQHIVASFGSTQIQ